METTADPRMLEVINNALAGIADGMALTVVRTSRSSIVRQALDFSTGLLTPHGELLAQGMCLPIHLGGMPAALHACLERYGDNIQPGDILINNDPYEGASHLPDIFLFKPIYAGDVLVAYACAMSHHTDMGGRVAGSNASDSSEIYQEGLRIPPLKLYEQGMPNETLFRLLEKAVRVPDKVLGDVMGQVAALTFGERELLRLVERHGVEQTMTYQEELLDYTERLARSAIRALPDGQWSFTDYVDDDGFSPDLIAIVANLTKRDTEVWVDFTGTSPQCKGAIQPILASTKAMVYAVVKTVLGGDIPNTGGYMRPIKITAPEGTFVNPLPPAPVAARMLGCVRIAQTTFGVFAQMLPSRVPASFGGCDYIATLAGYHKERTPWRAWVQVDVLLDVASGGRSYQDGMDAQASPVTNPANIPSEIMEVEHPVRIEEYALVPDTEGAGQFRGGLGMARSYRFRSDDTIVQVRGDRMKQTPYGLQGGHPSAPTRITLCSVQEMRPMPSKFIATANAGDAMRVEVPGAGGWGDPLEREPQSVLKDVIEEKVTPRRAREVYGVVVDAERRTVDLQATRRQREELRRGQGGG